MPVRKPFRFEDQVNLPKIETSKVYGKPEVWQGFWDQFSQQLIERLKLLMFYLF